MIIHNVILGLLLYSTTIKAIPLAEKESSTIRNQHTALPDPINDSFSDTSVNTLISKVVELSERYKKDGNGTIADVQHMIQIDKTLPRLTRGEIIDLLENITNTTPEMWKDRISKSRKKYQKAIMLVMPYTPKNTDALSIEELYTKPPITQIVDTKKSQNSNKHIEILALKPSTSRPPIAKRPFKPIKQVKVVTNQENKTQTKKDVINKQTPPIFEPTTYKPEQFIGEHLETSTKQSMKPERFSNHRYPDENGFIPSNKGINIISPPSLGPKPEVIPIRNTRPVQTSFPKITTSTKRPRITISTTTNIYSPLDNLDVPEEIKDGVKDVHFEQIDMTPPKYSSQYDSSVLNFPKQESTTENVRDLLNNIGVLPQQTTSIPDISGIADHLSPDMRDLLKSFGLIEDPNKPLVPEHEPIISQPEELHISPLSYSQFKPLPDSAPTREDMHDFLAEFGLVGNSQRSAKKLKTPDEPVKLPTKLTEIPNINMEMIPESMHDVLEEIGLSEKKEKKVLIDQEIKESHVFNPEHTYVSENEIKRLNQLLETIKRLEQLNRTATPEDLKDLDLENIRELTKILKQEASLPLDQQNFGPDPFDFDVSPEKNEIKRQQSTTTTESSTTVQSSENEAKNPSLAALEESFGGNTGAGAENVDASLPPPRRTGFYYLVDWNSFLEVGEEGKNKVNIRFSPQAGDASRFLSVNVP